MLVVLSLSALAGCGDDDDPTDVQSGPAAGSSGSTTAPISEGQALAPADLDGRTFTSTEVDGYDLVADSEIRLSFDGSRLVVNAGCNTMTGDYAVDETGLLAWTSEAAATMMGCADDLMAQDTWVSGLFTEGVHAELDDGTLRLTRDGLTIELVEEADADVVGTKWTLESIITGDSASSLPAGAEPATLEIGDDGAATVFAGCNSGGSSVVVSDDTITFSALALTKMACRDDGASTVEQAVVAVLDGEVEMAVDGPTLTLTKDGQGLTFRAS